jgi:chemotaxis protein methyltransferase CheR
MSDARPILSDLVIDDASFRFIAELVAENAGIALEPSKKALVQGRLSRRLRTLGMESFRHYCRLLRQPDKQDEIDTVINLITTNLTRFFREPHHFDHLTRNVLPDANRRAAQAGYRDARLRIWSAGCSTGQEPYSIAMVMARGLERASLWDARVLATDIDTDALAVAEDGEYPADELRHVPGDLARRWLTPGPNGRWRVTTELAALVSFRALNLMESWPMRGPFDVIFFRNVAIYFPRETQVRLHRRMAALLAPGGYLYLGHSESLRDETAGMTLVGKGIYRKEDGSS